MDEWCINQHGSVSSGCTQDMNSIVDIFSQVVWANQQLSIVPPHPRLRLKSGPCLREEMGVHSSNCSPRGKLCSCRSLFFGQGNARARKLASLSVCNFVRTVWPFLLTKWLLLSELLVGDSVCKQLVQQLMMLARRIINQGKCKCFSFQEAH